jgi:hypothetical protein
MNDEPYILVRVARELVAHLLKEESNPAVLIGVNELDDGTYEMVFRRLELSDFLRAEGGDE